MFGAARRAFPPTIRQLLAPGYAGERAGLRVDGWVKSVRKQKHVAFAVVSDGSSTHGLQAVFKRDVVPDGLTNGCSLTLRGDLVQSPGKGQDREFRVTAAEVVGLCDPDLYPIQKQALTVDYLRDQCHLRARVDKMGQMLRIRDSLMRGMHSYFARQGFTHAHTPIITSSDCEGAGETFTVSAEGGDDMPERTAESGLFFRKNAFLTVSAQLHLEALATARSRVYTLSPCFRAERSQTSRHLAEFWMLEAEWAFARAVGDVCAVVEDVVKEAAGAAVADEGAEGADVQERVVRVLAPDRPWRAITYTDAIRELQNAMRAPSSPAAFEYTPEWGQPLQSEHEKWLADAEGAPLFVTDYPRSLKPFYMRANDDGRTAACFDLLVPGLGELVGGSLREERLPVLDGALADHRLSGREEYEWYRELRMFGGAPHGGFGLGFERLVSVVSGQPNVRECVAMPRWAGRMLL